MNCQLPDFAFPPPPSDLAFHIFVCIFYVDDNIHLVVQVIGDLSPFCFYIFHAVTWKCCLEFTSNFEELSNRELGQSYVAKLLLEVGNPNENIAMIKMK